MITNLATSKDGTKKTVLHISLFIISEFLPKRGKQTFRVYINEVILECFNSQQWKKKRSKNRQILYV
jgi:hypothetical protein